MTLAELETAVSNALAAATEGGAYTEAPEPSDEPGSPYVKHIAASLHAAGVRAAPPSDAAAPLREALFDLRVAVHNYLAAVDADLRRPGTPADAQRRDDALAALREAAVR